MSDAFSRTRLILGKEAMDKLAASRVAVFGIGGVGSYAVEALARSGVGALDLIDNDKVSLSNINRQLYATLSTIGKYKADVAAQRIADINPDCSVTCRKTFFLPENASEIDFTAFDYIIDAIDTMSAKLALAETAFRQGIPIISCMSAGNKLDPTAFKVADIYSTEVCPIARTMRRELKKCGITALKVVYSPEPPTPRRIEESSPKEESAKREIPGSVAFVPSVAGLILASEAIKDLISSL